jgi:glutaredoxin
MDAIVFGTNNCGWCKKVANTLKDHQITVIKVDVTEENNLEQMKEQYHK